MTLMLFLSVNNDNRLCDKRRLMTKDSNQW